MVAKAPPVNTATPQKSMPLDSDAQPEVTNGLKFGVLIASLIIPVIGIILGIYFMNNSNLNKKAVGKSWLITGIIMAVIWFMFSMIPMTLDY